MSNQELITRFYQSFADHDVEGMLACYAPGVVFEDPAFGRLTGQDAHQMWRMLLSRANNDLEVSFGNVQADGKHASAEWWARYHYGKQKRMVINQISAAFVIEDGKIVRHTDTFDLWRWSRQALGLNGLLLGWTPFLKNKIQETTRGLLADFTARQSPPSAAEEEA